MILASKPKTSTTKISYTPETDPLFLMKTSTHPKLIPVLILFTIGILLAITLSAIAAWADYEAASYGFPNRANTPLNSLNCPILMTKDETQTVSVTIRNQTDKPLYPSVRVDRSKPFEPVTTVESLDLKPGESRMLKWSIGPQNIDLGQFIFANVLVYASHPTPDRESTCGVLVLPIRGNGQLILVLATIFSVLSIASGAYLLQTSNLSIKQKRPALFLSFAIFLTLTVSFMGLWMQAILLLTITVLTIFTMLGSFLS